jgi:hypothetical protein
MAARRLLIVMLVLLGLSTLAAALVPQRTLNDGGSTATTTTRPTTTSTTATTVETVPPQIAISVGPKKLPLVRSRVGDQFTLLVKSPRPKEIAIPKLGLVGFASPGTPARFELLTSTPGTFGILFAASRKVAAKLEVTASAPEGKRKGRKKGAKPKEGSRSQARAGSSPT